MSVIQITSNEVMQELAMSDCIRAMESMFRDESLAISSQPQRVITRVDQDSIIMTMPGYSRNIKRFAVKVVSEFRKNPDRFGSKVQGGIVVLFDSENSRFLATIDSPRLTAIRTGAVSALATKLLSRTDSRRVGVIGSGEQARTMLEGITCVRNVEQAIVYSRDYAHARFFADEMTSRIKILVSPARDLYELGKNDNDILIVATNSSEPVLRWKEDVRSGMHINSIGTLADRRELDDETICNSLLFADTRHGVLSEAGDVMHAIRSGLIDENHIIGDLSDLVLERKEGRKTGEEVTLFKSVGFSLQDVYAANKLYENFMKKSE